MPSLKAVIFGLKGESLSPEEAAFFKKHPPLGFILFARNCKNPEQIRALTTSLQEVSGRSDVPILIDQEGGRVARLKPPHWRLSPAAGMIAAIADVQKAKQAMYLNTRLIAAELTALGVNVNCAPIADLLIPGCHDIVGDRAYGSEPEQVATLAEQVSKGLLDSNVMPILKHIPGHGRARADSHEELPVVTTSLDELRKTDFVPFKRLNQTPWGMTAHITYTAIDEKLPATLSPKAINLIREELGFDGLLLTDDLSMKALKGSFQERTAQSIQAGCDIVLHCNGDMAEMEAIAEATPAMNDEALRRYLHGEALRPKTPKPLSANENETAFQSLIA